MADFSLKYGQTYMNVSLSEHNLIGIIESTEKSSHKSEEEIIKEALQNPIESKKLSQIVKKGDSVCIIISDVTRLWQRMDVFLPYIVEELNSAGILDKDICFISATGSHRSQTEKEHKKLLGKKLSERFKVIDHDCRDENNMKYLGITSFKTPVKINKIAMECDHIIITGAIVFHDMAGFGGGRKSILPGISSFETIMANHSLSLSENLGEGTREEVGCGKLKDNPFHEDMVEAAKFVNPSFLFNVITDSEGKISAAVAGHYIKAHEHGCKMLSGRDEVNIKEKADLVIASCGGYPKDIDLYQASKTLNNAKEAAKKGGTILMLAECVEGIGHNEVQEIMEKYENNFEREKKVRENYTIAKYCGYLICEIAENYDLVLVSDLNTEFLDKLNIKVFHDVKEALKYVYKEKGNDLSAYVMPYGANSLPVYAGE